ESGHPGRDRRVLAYRLGEEGPRSAQAGCGSPRGFVAAPQEQVVGDGIGGQCGRSVGAPARAPSARRTSLVSVRGTVIAPPLRRARRVAHTISPEPLRSSWAVTSSVSFACLTLPVRM